MNAVPRVAVIMPAFNAAHTIAASLASACRQALADIEILVVDDGSTDMTAALVRAAACIDPRIRLIEQANAGPMAARNRAIAATGAPYIAPLDADDLWHPDYLAEMVAALEQAGAGFVYALHYVIDGAGRILASPALAQVEGAGFHRHLLGNFVGNGSAALFRRDALLAVGGYDPLCRSWGGAEDYLLQLRIAARWPIACVPRRLVGYRRVAGSVSDDPARMADARCSAVRTALRESAASPLPVRRWVAADADRTAAALLAMRGSRAAALVRLARALVRDPPATLADIARRLANRSRRPVAVPSRLFETAAAPREPAPCHDSVLAGRMRRLARLDAAMRLAHAPDPPGIALQPAEEHEEEVAGAPPVQPGDRTQHRQ